jgi:hypothetical protein
MSSILINTFKFKIAMDFIKLLTAIKIQISLWETKSIKSREINRIETLLLLYPERAFRELMNLKDSLLINIRPILIFKLQI